MTVGKHPVSRMTKKPATDCECGCNGKKPNNCYVDPDTTPFIHWTSASCNASESLWTSIDRQSWPQ